MKLSNTLYCLKRKKALRVAYFGGSITEGGAENGWRGRTTTWLRETFPNAEVTEIQAAIGGTGSELGAYRCDRDVIAHRPDLTFIEFAVNDSGAKAENTQRNIEACVRKIMRANPQGEIMFVYTITKTIRDRLGEGKPYVSRDVDEGIASYYNWPSVDIGTPLAEAVARAGGDWLKYTGDTVHPNAEGYAFCARAAIDALADLLSGDVIDAPITYPLPIPMVDNVPESAHLYDAQPLCTETAQPDTAVEHDWKKLLLTLARRWPGRIGANRPGAELTIPFHGTSIALYYMIASDSGMFEWRIDGGEWKRYNTFDHYALAFARAAFALLRDDLPCGDHTLTIRVCEEKDEQSTGRWIRIGAYGAR